MVGFVVVDTVTLFLVETVLEDLSLQVSVCSSFALFVSFEWQVLARAGTRRIPHPELESPAILGSSLERSRL